MIYRRDPNWKHRSLKPGPEIKTLRIFLGSSPEQEPNFISINDTKLSIPKLYESRWKMKDIYKMNYCYVKVGCFNIIW